MTDHGLRGRKLCFAPVVMRSIGSLNNGQELVRAQVGAPISICNLWDAARSFWTLDRGQMGN